jgi:hypothetical protein
MIGKPEKAFWRTLVAFAERRWVPALPAIVFVVACALGWIAAPTQYSLEHHGWFSTFFATCAQVVATLFVGYALGARYFLVGVRFSVATLMLVGVAEIAAVAALSPSLPHMLYGPLMGLAVGGGLGSLTAALLSALTVLAGEQQAAQTHFFEQIEAGATTAQPSHGADA